MGYFLLSGRRLQEEFMTSACVSITLSYLGLRLVTFFANNNKLMAKTKIKSNSIPNQSRGLRKIQPKSRFKKIKKGKRQPVWLKKKIDLI